MVSGQINVKFPKAIVDEIDAEIAKGRFRSRGELITTAVRQYLDEISDRECEKLRLKGTK